MQVLNVTLKTREQLHADAVALNATYPAFSVLDVSEYPDFRYTFEVGGNDSLVVEVNLTCVDEEESEKVYDTDIAVHNGDWASMREQHRAVGLVIDEFYARGYHQTHGHLIGD